MTRNTAGWIAEYRKKGALWIHDGNMKRPHALLTSGNHSSGFFNSRLVIADEPLLRDAAADLLEIFKKRGGAFYEIKGVVGPQTGATKLAQFLSEKLRCFANKPFHCSPAKHEEDSIKSMVFTEEEIGLINQQRVLLCEDVITTAKSVELAAAAVEKAGGYLLPYVLVLVNRSGLEKVNGKQIIALIDRHMSTWTPDECLLCKESSEAVRPKDNWGRLNAEH